MYYMLRMHSSGAGCVSILPSRSQLKTAEDDAHTHPSATSDGCDWRCVGDSTAGHSEMARQLVGRYNMANLFSACSHKSITTGIADVVPHSKEH